MSYDDPTPEELAALDGLVERLALASEPEERDQLRFVDIPNHMFLTLGLREHVTASRSRVEIEESIVIKVRAGRRSELHQWLRENGYLEELSALRAASQNKSAERKAETAVLRPLVSRLLAEGVDFDLELLGVTRFAIARLSGDSPDRSTERGVA